LSFQVLTAASVKLTVCLDVAPCILVAWRSIPEDSQSSSWPESYLTNLILVHENRVLRRIFGPKRDEVTGGGRKLHNEELHGCTVRPVLLE
jgi:hypothetical protein